MADEVQEAWDALKGYVEPFGRWSDLECVKPSCYREALIEDGRRIAYCEVHLPEMEAYAGESYGTSITREEIVNRGLVIDARDLSLQQRVWTPGGDMDRDTDRDVTRYLVEWPHADRVEVWSGVIMFENRWQMPWTWRSVAMAAKAYPDRRVRLVHSYLQVPGRPGFGA